MAERLGRSHRAIDAVLVRDGEHFFCRQIRREQNAVLTDRLTAHPEMTGGQSKRQVRARAAIAQRVVPFAIQRVSPFRECVQMPLPCRDRIGLVEAAQTDDGVPELLHAHVGRHVRKDPGRPPGISPRRRSTSWWHCARSARETAGRSWPCPTAIRRCDRSVDPAGGPGRSRRSTGPRARPPRVRRALSGASRRILIERVRSRVRESGQLKAFISPRRFDQFRAGAVGAGGDAPDERSGLE